MCSFFSAHCDEIFSFTLGHTCCHFIFPLYFSVQIPWTSRCLSHGELNTLSVSRWSRRSCLSQLTSTMADKVSWQRELTKVVVNGKLESRLHDLPACEIPFTIFMFLYILENPSDQFLLKCVEFFSSSWVVNAARPVCPGSAPGSFPVGSCPEYLQRVADRGQR